MSFNKRQHNTKRNVILFQQDDTPRLRRTPAGGATPSASIIPEYALSPFSLLKRYSTAPRPASLFDSPMTDTQIEKISADLPPTESQMNVDRLMSDIDILMPTILNQRTASFSSSSSSSLNGSGRSNPTVIPGRSFFLAQQMKQQMSNDETAGELKVSWVDESTEAERLRQNQLHNLNEMTQIDHDYTRFYV